MHQCSLKMQFCVLVGWSLVTLGASAGNYHNGPKYTAEAVIVPLNVVSAMKPPVSMVQKPASLPIDIPKRPPPLPFHLMQPANRYKY
jgi:hypothetical protein